MAETLDGAIPESIVRKAHLVLESADGKGMMLATAESCTGGLLAALLTDVPGLSHVFERGFVAYSKSAKCDLLDIDRDKVEGCGAVSREIAIDMAEGALRRSGAEVALSITGFAGPGDEGDEEGLVHFACCRKGGAMTHREEHFGSIGREGVRKAALEVALDMMAGAVGE
ncbi:competence damage-inducible protein A [Novosphingobium marinum]|uniref:Nicotinamide-nucleotide amidase n=1 Tax=Novosphingobium marinum TaxID=1514948 RepID=A0A7Z0BVZ1_9SPHN|nr:CinA family protein [Novosphingobium marinum]NYH96798.1 nicotinamide-nucleotide amidase [Novosphingobium marinum]GGC40158.1 competence damage-inducible protein A [Novosphingobium marinum]